MITIDGSLGEGGGQILRTSLAMSLVTQQPFKIKNIRSKRKRPGLGNQHLTCVKAAKTISQADVEGAEKGSQELTFRPDTVVPGDYIFDIGTAGSTTLVAQTVLPALWSQPSQSVITLKGGTYNPMAPTIAFLQYAFLPIINSLGPQIQVGDLIPGFYPKGGGKFTCTVIPAKRLLPMQLDTRGSIRGITAIATLSQLKRSIGERELCTLREKLPSLRIALDIKELPKKQAKGPGNALVVIVQCGSITEVISSIGEKGLPAERVAERAADELMAYLDLDVPVGPYLADQLLIPLALTGKGHFRTGPLTKHTTTNMHVLSSFLGVSFKTEDLGNATVKISIASPK